VTCFGRGFPKMEIFDGLYKHFLCSKNTKNSILLADGIPEREILMAYISRSCDLPKVKMGGWVAYVIRSHD
jgi:hypothetical protein